MTNEPKLIEFPSIGEPSLGYITVVENDINIPFEIKRAYWTYYTPQDVIRGGHAHLNLKQVIFAVSGSIEMTLTYGNVKDKLFQLDKPSIGLFIPSLVWREIKFSHSAVLLCLASEIFTEEDYVRDKSEFYKLTKNHEI